MLLGLSGLCASVMDTLGQTLLQRNADEHERGAAMGLWVFSVGFGPVGHLTLGAAASVFGAPITQAVSGLMLGLVAVPDGLEGTAPPRTLTRLGSRMARSGALCAARACLRKPAPSRLRARRGSIRLRDCPGTRADRRP